MEDAAKDGMMWIGELSHASGLPVSTIKYYLSEGLLPPPMKIRPNASLYDEKFLERLRTIAAMRAEGLPIRSIKSILDRYSFDGVSDWEEFRGAAKEQACAALDEEQLAALGEEERKTNEVLDAALKVFSASGYHNATVDDIAREAGISKGACYQHFSSKEEIFIATLDRTLESILEQAEAEARDVEGALPRLGVKGMSFVSRYGEVQFVFAGLISEVLGGNEKLADKASEIYDRVAGFLAEDIEDGVREGVFRPVSATTVGYALMGIAEMAGNRNLVEKDFDVLGFFMDLMGFLQHGLLKE